MAGVGRRAISVRGTLAQPSVFSRVARRPRPRRRAVERLRLADMPRTGEWVLLGEDRHAEIAFGAMGRFWAGETVWEEIDAADFAGYTARIAKIACNFSLRPYGQEQYARHLRMPYEGNRPEVRKESLRFWRPLSPFIGVVLRAQLSVVESEAEFSQ